MPRRVIVQARDRAAGPVKDRLRRDRENAPQSLEGVLAYLEEHLFDASLSVKTALRATGGNWGVATLAGAHFDVPLKDYFRTAQVETARRLPPVLRRDYGLEAPTGEVAAAVGLPVLRTFCEWHVKVTGTPPEILLWPRLLKPSLDYYTWNRFARGNRRPGDCGALLTLLAWIESPPSEFRLLGDLDPLERARAETVDRIQRDKDLLPDHLKPLLGYIAEHLFDGLNATEAARQSPVRDKENAGEQLRFHLGETVKSYITKRWVETVAYAVGESDSPIGKIAKSLGQHSQRTVYRWFKRHTGENPGDLRRSGPVPKELVDQTTWRLAGNGVPWAVQAVTDCLSAMEGSEGSGVELTIAPEADVFGLEDEGILPRLESEVRAHPVLAASVAIDRMWRDPRLIYGCVRAALDTSCRSRLLGSLRDLDVGSSDLAQLAYSAAQARLRKTRKHGADPERSLTGDVEQEEERVALTELVLGLALLRDLPSDQAAPDGLTFLRAGSDRLAKSADDEIRQFMAESKIAIDMVRECLYRSVEMEFAARTQAVELAGEAFEKGLLPEGSHPDEYRWAVASKANLARIATHYTEAKELLDTIALTRPFDDMAIAGTVRWIAGVIQGETGDWQGALRSLDEALLLIEATEDHINATKVRVSKAVVSVYCGDEAAYDQFQICLGKSGDSPALQFSVMANLVITKSYLSLSAKLPFDFEEFVTVASRSAEMKAWIPFCTALMETRPRIACDLFLRASTEFEVTTQVMPATTALLLATMEAAKDDQPAHAYQLGVKAAMALKTSQVFGGRLALAAETFLANLGSEAHFSDRARAFLRKVQMPYRSSAQR